MVFGARHPPQFEQRWKNIEADGLLVGRRIGLDTTGPIGDRRHAMATFPNTAFETTQHSVIAPGVGAIVGAKKDQCLFGDA